MSLLKNKAAAFAVAVVLGVGVVGVTAEAVEIPDTVRIGLNSAVVKSGVANIGNEAVAVGSENNGQFVENAVFYSQGGFTAVASNGMNIVVDELMDYKEAETVAQLLSGYGFTAVPAFLESGFTVFVSGATPEQVRAISGYSAKIADANTANLIELRSGNKPIVMLSPKTQISPKDNTGVNILGKSKYRGRIELNRSNTGISAVNVIDIEDYLCGVVAAEMPASYELEALKAQAVAARTYAVKRLGSHGGQNYQLCDSIHCQVYKGVAGEFPTTTMAVNQTENEIILYNNEPIDALFFASSGGYTENSENVWLNSFDYLKAKPDTDEVDALEWEKTFTLSDLNALLAKNGENIGQAQDVVIGKVSPGGRVQELAIIGTSGKKLLTNESIRTYFGGTAQGTLPSKMFTVNSRGGVVLASNNTETVEVNISTSNGSGSFVFSGRGNGHGCGLSQKGAQGKAILGDSYDEILKYYYTGVTIYPEMGNTITDVVPVTDVMPTIDVMPTTDVMPVISLY